jgi:hypothetical protein
MHSFFYGMSGPGPNGLPTSSCGHLTPECGFISSKSLEQAIIEIGEALETMRQVSWCDVPRRADGEGTSDGSPGVTVVVPTIHGLIAKPDRGFDDAKGHGVRPLRLAMRAPLILAVAQYLGLDPKQIGLDCGRATQTSQQRCQPQH